MYYICLCTSIFGPNQRRECAPVRICGDDYIKDESALEEQVCPSDFNLPQYDQLIAVCDKHWHGVEEQQYDDDDDDDECENRVKIESQICESQ